VGLGTVLGPLIAWFLFLTGMGAGAYIVAVVANVLGEPYKPLVKPGIFLAAPLVAIGVGLLMLNLGDPFRVYLAFLRPQSSIMSVGIIITTVFILLGLLHIAALMFQQMKLGQKGLCWLGGINAVFALGTAIFTGLLLAVMQAVPFWNTPIVPLLFVVSALSTGMGAVLVVEGLWCWIIPKTEAEKGRVVELVHALSRLDLPLIVTELLTLFFLVFLLVTSPSTAAESVRYLMSGGYAGAFWLGIVVVGLVIPVILEVWKLTRVKELPIVRLTDLSVVVGLCLLIGGIILRYAILAAGANVSGTL
jgi:polysulfide reductase chain C